METTKVLMVRNKLGSPDGVTVKHYLEGETYELPVGLADTFLFEKVAEKVQAEKAVEAAPENKAILKAPKNKAAV